jgi:hypothetical protein
MLTMCVLFGSYVNSFLEDVSSFTKFDSLKCRGWGRSNVWRQNFSVQIFSIKNFSRISILLKF